MARRPEIAELPTRLLVVEIGSGKRWKRIAAFGAVAAVVLGAGVYAAVRAADAREAASLETAWGGLGTCLLGEPLREGETAGSRVLGVQLAVLGIPKERRAKPNELPWPASCSGQAFAVAEHAAAAPKGGAGLAEAAQALGKALKEDVNATTDFRAQVEKVWTEAGAAKLKGVAAPEVTPAPKPAAPLFSMDALKAGPKFLSGTFSLASVREEPSTGGKLYFVVDQKDMPEGPVLCRYDGAEPSVHCMKVPAPAAKLSPGLRLLGTTDDGARPFFFAGDRGQLGIFPPDAKDKIAAITAYGATARADGSLLFLTRQEPSRDLHLVYKPVTGASTDHSALPAAEIESPLQAGLFWDWLAYKSAAKSGTVPHLVVRKLGDGGQLAAAIDVGEMAQPSPSDKSDKESQLSACRSDEATALRLRGASGDAIAFYTAGRWAAPVKAATRGGAMTCRGIEAVTTQVTHAAEQDKDYPTIAQSRCNSSGCTTATVTMREMLAGRGELAPPDANAMVAADVGGKLLVVWNSGYLGGLRMRLAPAQRIKDAEDVVIADGRDTSSGSKLSAFVELRVIAASSYALLFVSTTAGMQAFRVDASGKVTPLPGAI